MTISSENQPKRRLIMMFKDLSHLKNPVHPFHLLKPHKAFLTLMASVIDNCWIKDFEFDVETPHKWKFTVTWNFGTTSEFIFCSLPALDQDRDYFLIASNFSESGGLDSISSFIESYPEKIYRDDQQAVLHALEHNLF